MIFAAGTGNPYFSTDTAAVLRAIQIKANVIIKATSVDGVYSADPKEDPNATFYDEISYRDVMLEELKVMDQTAITLCKENSLPLIVLNIHRPGVIAAPCRASASAPSSDEHDSTDREGLPRVDGEGDRGGQARVRARFAPARRSPNMLDTVRVEMYGQQMHAEPGGEHRRARAAHAARDAVRQGAGEGRSRRRSASPISASSPRRRAARFAFRCRR